MHIVHRAVKSATVKDKNHFSSIFEPTFSPTFATTFIDTALTATDVVLFESKLFI